MDHQELAGLPLDGNAAAGLLRELFAPDMTEAEVTCGNCGVVAMVGETRTLRRSDGRNISLRLLRQRRHAISPYTRRYLARHARLPASIRPVGAVTKSGMAPRAQVIPLAATTPVGRAVPIGLPRPVANALNRNRLFGVELLH